jgi:adenylosuccinate synthase
MSATVIIGAQWGDEGKGKIVDLLAPQMDCVVRFQGGANAGHTLVIGETTHVFHLIPSGILHEGVECCIGNGVVVDAAACLEELARCRDLGLPLEGRFWVSHQAHLVLPHHQRIDVLREEQASAGTAIGTTKRGIGPAYEAKVARRGLRVGDLLDPAHLRRRLEAIVPQTNAQIERLYGGEPIGLEETCKQLENWGEALRPFITDTVERLHRARAAGKAILLEGAQGTALDIDHGTYPYVTSSTTVSAGACSGSGLGPRDISGVIGVTKAYATRVGHGPFPTELDNAVGEALRKNGGEFGATTGRPRRCGWLDGVALRRAAQINGLTGLALTKVDVLQGTGEVQVATGYTLHGKRIETWPHNVETLTAVEPIYETLPAWTAPCTPDMTRSTLPPELQHFLERVESIVGVPVVLLSFGPDRSAHLQFTPVAGRRCWL